MENAVLTPQETTEHTYNQAAQLLLEQKQSPQQAIESLLIAGVPEQEATMAVEDLHLQIIAVRKKQAGKDMLYGGLWCVGGTVATIANIGFIFWGAILFGGIQFIRGAINYAGAR